MALPTLWDCSLRVSEAEPLAELLLVEEEDPICLATRLFELLADEEFLSDDEPLTEEEDLVDEDEPLTEEDEDLSDEELLAEDDELLEEEDELLLLRLLS